MKRTILLLALALSLGLLAGCFPIDTTGTLTLSAPESGYPPTTIKLEAFGVTGGQYTFSVEGKTYTQTNNTLVVTVHTLPIEVSVVWFDGDNSQSANATIWLSNTGPVPGRIVLNFDPVLGTLHSQYKYIVTYPDAYDREGGPITLVYATVKWGDYGDLAVFCPPFTGINPPTLDVYNVKMHTGGTIKNAFIFWYGWPVHIEPATGIPYIPPSQGNIDGYPLASLKCGPFWSKVAKTGSAVTITTEWIDEMDARTVDVQTIQGNPYIGCGVQTESSTCP